MPKVVERALSPEKVQAAKVGLWCDGRGLYLQVTLSKDGQRLNRSWVLRYRVNGKRRHLGLGALPAVTLVEARAQAELARRKVRQGLDPVTIRHQERDTVRGTALQRFCDAYQRRWQREYKALCIKRIRIGSKWSRIASKRLTTTSELQAVKAEWQAVDDRLRELHQEHNDTTAYHQSVLRQESRAAAADRTKELKKHWNVVNRERINHAYEALKQLGIAPDQSLSKYRRRRAAYVALRELGIIESTKQETTVNGTNWHAASDTAELAE